MAAPRFHTLRVAQVKREALDAISVWFDVPPELADAYAFTQGQHITLKLRIGGEELRRAYSICSGVDDGHLRVGIRKLAGGRFSDHVHRELAAGDFIEVLTPEGRFYTPLDPSHSKQYAAFVAGSGITPVVSLIRTTLRREPSSRFTLVYANRQHATTMFQEELQDLKDRYMTRFALYNLFSREQQDVALFNGRLDGAKIKAFTSSIITVPAIDDAFVCGPEGMIDDVCAALLECGMPPERLHVERFGVPIAASGPNPAPRKVSDASITIISDGVRREVAFRSADRSLLEAALAAGLELPYSCKGGMCCTCRAKLLDGQVRMQKNFSLERRDLDAGFILTCQARPLTERITISFDER